MPQVFSNQQQQQNNNIKIGQNIKHFPFRGYNFCLFHRHNDRECIVDKFVFYIFFL